MNSFTENYSNLYDTLYQDKDYARETQFVAAILGERIQTKDRTLLDFGCGTGRHAIQLSHQGWKVTGVDSSQPMLRLAQENAAKNGGCLELLSTLPQERQFGAILSLFSTLNYIPHGQPLKTLLQRFRSLLLPGGVMILEIWNGACVPFRYKQENTKTGVTPSGRKFVRKSEVTLDWMNQQLIVKYDILDETDTALFTEKHRMYYHTPHEFKRELLTAGFEILEITRAFERAAPEIDAFDLIYTVGVPLYA